MPVDVGKLAIGVEDLWLVEKTSIYVTPFVFAQMRDGVIHYLVHMPESDYYKLQLYALPAADPNKSLPNVYNYLIHVLQLISWWVNFT
jgi:hypothetical protein